ncbi:MAG: family 1 glycosylhydrolase [Acidimicrobiales bacterium]
MQGFPDNFWWGTTQSATGAEGAAPASDWSLFERSGRAQGSSDGNGFATNYRDDFEMLATAGLRHIRLTVEWARLEPTPGRYDSDAVEHYRHVFEAAAEAGIAAWATLHNTSLPGWFADDERGFRDPRSRSYFWPRHVDFVAEQLDGLVAGWSPIEDPVGWALRGFQLGSRPPGRSGDSGVLVDAIEGALEASRIAWELLRGGRQPVMGVFGLPPIRAVRPEAEQDAQRWHDLVWSSWVGAIRDGEFRIPGKGFRERSDWVGAFDYIGLAIRNPVAVEADDTLVPWPVDGRVDGTGFAPNPDQDAQVLRDLAEQLPGKPLVIASHGVATDDDRWRDDIVKATVHQLKDALADGVPLHGYFHDTAIDGYGWLNGFEQPTGLFDRNRNPKPSATWLTAQLA